MPTPAAPTVRTLICSTCQGRGLRPRRYTVDPLLRNCPDCKGKGLFEVTTPKALQPLSESEVWQLVLVGQKLLGSGGKAARKAAGTNDNQEDLPHAH